VTYVSTEPCIDVKDRSCIEECPVDCIYEGDRMLYIHPDECVDCGACEPVCPVEAILYEDDVPAQWKEFTAATPPSSPRARSRSAPRGGAANLGSLVRDVAFVANYQVPDSAQPSPRADVGRAGRDRSTAGQPTGAGWRSTGASPADVGHLD
jgi:NAD-dependent dihydropyrimidine dehydrogenase PreA subunit